LSIRAQIESLESLAAIDVELRRLDEQTNGEQGVLDKLRTELAQLDERITRDRAKVAEMDRMRSDLSTELRQMSHQVERSREKLARSRNERESNASQREVEEVRKLLRDREIELDKLSNFAEEARVGVEAAETQRAKVAAELGGCEGDISTRLTAVRAERAAKAATRAEIAAKLPSITLRRYEQVRIKKGTALAPTTSGTCLACHISLPPMLFQRLLRSEVLEQCPSCARILYYQPPAPQPGADH
jgi:predicted  nucleic acid-binding Zn-ribbon protein